MGTYIVHTEFLELTFLAFFSYCSTFFIFLLLVKFDKLIISHLRYFSHKKKPLKEAFYILFMTCYIQYEPTHMEVQFDKFDYTY